MRKITFLLVISLLTMIACDRKFPGFKKNDNGLYYKFHVRNKEGKKPVEGDMLTLNMQYRTSKDSVFFSTSKKTEPVRLPLKKPVYKGDIYEGFAMMAEGDSATFVINADSFFVAVAGVEVPSFIDTNFFYIDVKLEKVQTKAEYEKAEAERIEKLRALENEILKTYLEKNNITQAPEKEGYYYLEEKAGKGKLAEPGTILKMHYSVGLINTPAFFDSKQEGEPMVYELGSRESGEGFDLAVQKMKPGGKATIIVPSQLAFGDKGYGSAIPPCATLVFKVELLNVYTKEEYEKQQLKEAEQLQNDEKKTLSNYLKKNNITTPPRKSGLYYIETQKGTGPQAIKGKKVSVHYRGTLLDGTEFDQSYKRGKPYEFTLGEGAVIAGWDEGISLMKKGGKATLIIPSSLAYGPQAAGIIPPYSTLVFDVELVDVK